MSWAPLPQDGLHQAIAAACDRMTCRQRSLWHTIKISPAKWSQTPYGDDGGGFWAVGIIGRVVIWYNDIEEGFEFSRYTKHGSIAEYACSQSELEHVVEQLLSLIKIGQLTRDDCGAPEPIPYPRSG